MVVWQQRCTHKEWKRFSQHKWGIEYSILHLIPLLVCVYTRQPNQAQGWAQIFEYSNIQIFWVLNIFLILLLYYCYWIIFEYSSIFYQNIFLKQKIWFLFHFPQNVSIRVPIFDVFHFGSRIYSNICWNLCVKYIWIFISEVKFSIFWIYLHIHLRRS